MTSTISATSAGHQAEREQRRAEHAEEQQRLLAEPQLEPHRQHVEHADGNPRQTPNFDLPACRGYSGTGISVTVNPCAAAITIM